MINLVIVVIIHLFILNNIMIEFPKTTQAAILVAQHKDLVIDTIELPNSLEVGQVLVKLHVSGICGSQVGEMDGRKGPDKFLPHLLGHEGFASVLKVGPGVKTVRAGDKVILHWRKGNGIESAPPMYRWRGEELNAGLVTTFNKHAVVSENRCTKVNFEINPNQAALFGCAITTGFGVVENDANVRIGDSVVIYGAGGIGLSIIQASALKSAWPIIAIDLFDNRLRLAQELGASHVINASNNDPEKAINEILGNSPLNTFIDNTGLPSVIELGYKLINSEGKLVLVGVPKYDENISIHSLPLHFGKIIIGSHGGKCKPVQDIPRFLKLLNQGILKLDRLISEEYTLERINEAIVSMRKGLSAGRVIIKL